MIIVGLDLSLTSTGVARIDTDGDLTTTTRIRSAGKADATLDQRDVPTDVEYEATP